MASVIRDDLTSEQYHDDRSAIGKSGLDYIARSPAHYWAAYLDPHRVRGDPTPAMIVGTCWHYAVLEPERFTERVVSAPEVDRRTKAGKGAYAEWVTANPGKIILPSEDFDAVRHMRDALHAHAAARVLIQDGVTERSFYWRCPETGMRCKARPDFLRRDGVIIDLKSTEDARPDAFGRSAWNYRYYVQAPWYLDGVAHATNAAPQVTESVSRAGHAARQDHVAAPAVAAPELFIFIAQEKAPPYAVMVYEASVPMLNAGRMEYQRNMATYAACMRDNYWPTYPEEILPLELPSWAMRNAARMPA